MILPNEAAGDVIVAPLPETTIAVKCWHARSKLFHPDFIVPRRRHIRGWRCSMQEVLGRDHLATCLPEQPRDRSTFYNPGGHRYDSLSNLRRHREEASRRFQNDIVNESESSVISSTSMIRKDLTDTLLLRYSSYNKRQEGLSVTTSSNSDIN